MPKVSKVTQMEVDEISFVDRPANQHAHVVLAKRAEQEDDVPDFYDLEGDPIAEDQLAPGMVVQDAQGELYEIAEGSDEDDDEEFAEDDERELVGVGKSAFFTDSDSQIVASISDTLSKAIADEGQREVLSKQFAELEKRAQAAESRVHALEEVAKSERDLRLTREYIAKAADYNVPIPPDELGPVLFALAEAEMGGVLPAGSCDVLHKALTAAGEMLFAEAGYDGSATNDDPLAELEAHLEAQVAKGADGISKAEAMTAFFEQHPEAYDAYRAERH